MRKTSAGVGTRGEWNLFLIEATQAFCKSADRLGIFFHVFREKLPKNAKHSPLVVHIQQKILSGLFKKEKVAKP